jgi:hypothetical protein
MIVILFLKIKNSKFLEKKLFHKILLIDFFKKLKKNQHF